jgi:multidrug efflux pump subunit AcrA (membrane-fusion protein)
MRGFSPVSPMGLVCLVITPLPLRIFSRAGKLLHKQTAIAVAMVASCLLFPVPMCISSAEAQLGTPAAQKQLVPVKPSPKVVSEDRSEQFAAVVVPATIQPFFVTDLYAKDSGYVSQVNNDLGDHVKNGQVLAVIEDPELQAQFDKAQAGVQLAKAALEVAKRQLAGMQADLVLQQVTLKRQKELFAGKAATAQTLDEAQAKQGVSSANLETGKAKIRLAEADIEAAKAEADRLQALLQYDKIVAPYDCVVTRRLINPGDLVQAATSTRTSPLFSCQELDVVRVFADVPEASAADIRPGLPAEVKLYGLAGLTLRGTVTRIATALDPATRTMRVEIDLPNPDARLLPGMYAQVTLGRESQQMDPPKQ